MNLLSAVTTTRSTAYLFATCNTSAWKKTQASLKYDHYIRATIIEVCCTRTWTRCSLLPYHLRDKRKLRITEAAIAVPVAGYSFLGCLLMSGLVPRNWKQKANEIKKTSKGQHHNILEPLTFCISCDESSSVSSHLSSSFFSSVSSLCPLLRPVIFENECVVLIYLYWNF